MDSFPHPFGAASVVLRDVPEDCTVVGIPGRISHHRSISTDALAQDSTRDMSAEVIQVLYQRVKELEWQIEQLRERSADRAHIFVSNGSNGTNGSTKKSVNGNSAKSLTTLKQERDRLIEEFLDGSGI